MADSLTRLIEITQQIETLLEERFGASGRGLHEKLTSVEKQVPANIQKKIRFIATIRNKAVHENIAAAAENLPSVQQNYQQILPFLENSLPKKGKRRFVYFGLLLAVLAVLWIIGSILQKIVLGIAGILLIAGIVRFFRRRNRTSQSGRGKRKK